MSKTLPPNPEGMNDSRAQWAQRCLEVFSSLTGADYADCLSDMLCDLMHLCDRDEELGKFEDQLERAKEHYKAETEGE